MSCRILLANYAIKVFSSFRNVAEINSKDLFGGYWSQMDMCFGVLRIILLDFVLGVGPSRFSIGCFAAEYQ
jgi:hypothetical protein